MYNERWRMEFDDIHNLHKASWRASIFMWSDEVGYTDIIAGASPIVISWGGPDNDKFNPIIGSECTLNVVQTSESDITPSDFSGDFEHAPMLEVYKNGSLFWKGYLTADDIQGPIQYFPYGFSINFSDQIGLLKSEYGRVLPELYTNYYIGLSTYLTEKGLKLTGIEADVLFSRGLYSLTESTGYKDDWFFKSVTPQLFIDSNTIPTYTYNIIETILKEFGARVVYSNNKFWVQRIEDLESETVEFFGFTTDGHLVDNPTLNMNKRIKGGDLSSADGLISGNNATIIFKSGYRRVIQPSNYLGKNVLKNPYWANINTLGHISYWLCTDWDRVSQKGTGVLDEFGELADPYHIQFDGADSTIDYIYQKVEVETSRGLSLSFAVSDQSSENFGYVLFAGTDMSDPYEDADYVYVNGEWVEYNYSIVTPLFLFINKIDRDSPNKIVNVSEDVKSPPPHFPPAGSQLPITYPTEVALYFVVGDNTSAKIYPVNLHSKDSDNDSVEARLAKTSNYSDKQLEDPAIIDHNRAGKNVLNYAFVDRESPIRDGMSWTSVKGDADSIQQYNVMSRLNQNQLPYRTLTIDVFSNTIGFENTIKYYDGQDFIYLQTSDEYDIRNCLHRMNLSELKITGKFNDNEKLKYYTGVQSRRVFTDGGRIF